MTVLSILAVITLPAMEHLSSPYVYITHLKNLSNVSSVTSIVELAKTTMSFDCTPSGACVWTRNFFPFFSFFSSY